MLIAAVGQMSLLLLLLSVVVCLWLRGIANCVVIFTLTKRRPAIDLWRHCNLIELFSRLIGPTEDQVRGRKGQQHRCVVWRHYFFQTLKQFGNWCCCNNLVVVDTGTVFTVKHTCTQRALMITVCIVLPVFCLHKLRQTLLLAAAAAIVVIVTVLGKSSRVLCRTVKVKRGIQPDGCH